MTTLSFKNGTWSYQEVELLSTSDHGSLYDVDRNTQWRQIERPNGALSIRMGDQALQTVRISPIRNSIDKTCFCGREYREIWVVRQF